MTTITREEFEAAREEKSKVVDKLNSEMAPAPWIDPAIEKFNKMYDETYGGVVFAGDTIENAFY